MVQKKALVIGSSKGIGFSIAEYLLDEGFCVFGASRSGTPIEHGNFFDITTDITKEKSVENLFEEISLMTPGIELVVLSAGFCFVDPVIETASSDFLNHLMTNTLGPFLILKHLHPFLIQNKTHIVSLSSEMGKTAEAGWSAYSASKFALEGLLESCEKEWKELGIRFTTLRPWAIDTHRWENLGIEVDKNKLMSKEEFVEIFSLIINDKKSWIKNLNFQTHA
jgi:NAD(P)-dependent dehydrogenase (short-subunit alcohol dehydrogenase family)